VFRPGEIAQLRRCTNPVFSGEVIFTSVDFIHSLGQNYITRVTMFIIAPKCSICLNHNTKVLVPLVLISPPLNYTCSNAEVASPSPSTFPCIKVVLSEHFIFVMLLKLLLTLPALYKSIFLTCHAQYLIKLAATQLNILYLSDGRGLFFHPLSNIYAGLLAYVKLLCWIVSVFWIVKL
jgi:hypothetical protein